MKFTLYLELGFRAEDLRILDLLRFPSELTFAGKAEWSAQWWSGKTKRMRAKERETILQRIAADGVNEVQLKCRTHAKTEREHKQLKITDAWLWLNPSPASSLWADVPTTPLKNHADERNRLSFGGGKSFREEYKEKYRLPYPTVTEYMLGIELHEELDDVTMLQQMCIELLCATAPATLAGENIFGYGCVHGSCRKQMMLQSLGGVAVWIDQLGEKFENIYPILIGSLASCEGLVSALGGRCSLFRIGKNSPSAIVSIPPEKVDEIRNEPATKEWVVMRDLSALDAPSSTIEELYRRYSAVSWIAPFVKR
jgi:hypothetical protein